MEKYGLNECLFSVAVTSLKAFNFRLLAFNKFSWSFLWHFKINNILVLRLICLLVTLLLTVAMVNIHCNILYIYIYIYIYISFW